MPIFLYEYDYILHEYRAVVPLVSLPRHRHDCPVISFKYITATALPYNRFDDSRDLLSSPLFTHSRVTQFYFARKLQLSRSSSKILFSFSFSPKMRLAAYNSCFLFAFVCGARFAPVVNMFTRNDRNLCSVIATEI